MITKDDNPLTPPGYSEFFAETGGLNSFTMWYFEKVIYLNRFKLLEIGEGDIKLGISRARETFMQTIVEYNNKIQSQNPSD